MSTVLSSYTLHGLTALPVQIEVEIGPGMPVFSIVGMAGTSVQEAKERVRSALVSSGFHFPLTRKIVNLAPAELSKSGSHFDLAIALGFLLAMKELPALSGILAVGELGLSGELRPVKGLLPALLFARDNGISRVLLPRSNLAEASLVEGLSCLGFDHLKEVVHFLKTGEGGCATNSVDLSPTSVSEPAEVIYGHAQIKRAMAIAAVGSHHLLLSGPPGSGKSVLARQFPGLLPPLDKSELLEVLAVHSLAEKTRSTMTWQRPLRSIHPRSTPMAVFGGGPSLVPGELSLAHRGVLFMDELPEFSREILEGLRGPLEGQDVVLRSGKSVCHYPSKFQLIAARNPCPCGYSSDPERRCVCTSYEKTRYLKKISGPILDRLDIVIEVPRLSYDDFKKEDVLSFTLLREKVALARERRRSRFQKERLDLKTDDLLRQATHRFHLSGRSLQKILSVARSIADFEGSDLIQAVHVAEALQYRV